jgi:hypothetical protein
VSEFNPIPPHFQFGRPYSYYHVGIKPPTFPLFIAGIHSLLDGYLNTLNGDWFRYASQNYVVWTSLAPSELANGIRATRGLENLILFITPFQPSWANGYMPQEFWNWLQKPRFPGYKYTPNTP